MAVPCELPYAVFSDLYHRRHIELFYAKVQIIYLFVINNVAISRSQGSNYRFQGLELTDRPLSPCSRMLRIKEK